MARRGHTVRAAIGGALLAVSVGSLVMTSTLAVQPVPFAGTYSTSGIQAREESLAEDLTATAKAKGWTLAQARAQYEAAEAVGAVAIKLAASRPDIFIGSALATEPGADPRLYVKGPADAALLALVKAAGRRIEIVDDQPFSFEELEARKVRVHDALVAMGFDQVSTSINIAGRGVIPAGIWSAGGVRSDASTILAALPSPLRSSVDLTVNSEPIAGEDAAFGGMRTKATSTGFLCTSGWTVRSDVTLAFGVTDAGHCGSMNRIVDPATGVAHAMTFKAEHLGGYGDVEWFTTGQVEEGLFYAGPSTIRPVLYLEARAGISVDETVCLYGRSSNFRNCDSDVQDVSQRCTNAGITYDRMILMDADIGSGGDSGGPWFYDNRAFGAHHGPCGGVPGRDSFSVADLFDEALSIRVQIYE